MKQKTFIYYIFSYFLLSACTTHENHGYSFYNLSSVNELFSTSKESVTQKMGAPNFISSLDQENWYYVSQSLKKKAFLTPQLTSQEIIKLSFTGTIVTHITKLEGKDIKIVKFDPHFTKSAGDDNNLWREFIGNLGKYNVRPQMSNR
jgi:outer membrane protein assembly factor BamE (lipoprotein component of BamABCDE complex)